MNIKELFLFIFVVQLHGAAFAQECRPKSFSDFQSLVLLAKAVHPAVKLDKDVIQEWSITSRLPCKPPFKATYKKGPKNLFFSS